MNFINNKTINRYHDGRNTFHLFKKNIYMDLLNKTFLGAGKAVVVVTAFNY